MSEYPQLKVLLRVVQKHCVTVIYLFLATTVLTLVFEKYLREHSFTVIQNCLQITILLSFLLLQMFFLAWMNVEFLELPLDLPRSLKKFWVAMWMIGSLIVFSFEIHMVWQQMTALWVFWDSFVRKLGNVC